MKKLLILTSAILIFGGVCVLLAADQPSGKGAGDKGKAGQGMKMGRGEMGLGLYSRLNLTDDQKAKITEIMKSRHDQLSALKEDNSLTKEQKREKMKSIMESTQKQMDEVLTPEQNQQLEQLRAQMKEKMKERWQEKNKGENKPAAEAR